MPARQLLQTTSTASACTPATVDSVPGDVNGDCLFNILVRVGAIWNSGIGCEWLMGLGARMASGVVCATNEWMLLWWTLCQAT